MGEREKEREGEKVSLCVVVFSLFPVLPLLQLSSVLLSGDRVCLRNLQKQQGHLRLCGMGKCRHSHQDRAIGER